MIQVSDAYSQEEQALVRKLITENDVHTVIEIGSYQGCSALMWAQYPQISRIMCVDPFEVPPGSDWGPPDRNYYPEFERNLREHGVWYKIIVARGYSWNYQGVGLEYADLVYIDGDHSFAGCYNDNLVYLPKAKKVLLGDDHHLRPDGKPYYPGVVGAVQKLFHGRAHVQGRFWWLTGSEIRFGD